MSPPILPPGVKHAVDGLDARLEKLEAKSAEIDQRTRRSAEPRRGRYPANRGTGASISASRRSARRCSDPSCSITAASWSRSA